MRLTVELGFSNAYAKIIRVGIYLRILTGIDSSGGSNPKVEFSSCRHSIYRLYTSVRPDLEHYP